MAFSYIVIIFLLGLNVFSLSFITVFHILSDLLEGIN